MSKTKRKKMKTRFLEAAVIEPNENAMMPRARKRKAGVEQIERRRR